jgi:hypothetical protein
MEIFDVVGQLLLERKRHGLCQSRTATDRQLRLGQQDFDAGHEDDDALASRKWSCVQQCSSLHGAQACAVSIDHEPSRGLIGR